MVVWERIPHNRSLNQFRIFFNNTRITLLSGGEPANNIELPPAITNTGKVRCTLLAKLIGGFLFSFYFAQIGSHLSLIIHNNNNERKHGRETVAVVECCVLVVHWEYRWRLSA